MDQEPITPPELDAENPSPYRLKIVQLFFDQLAKSEAEIVNVVNEEFIVMNNAILVRRQFIEAIQARESIDELIARACHLGAIELIHTRQS